MKFDAGAQATSPMGASAIELKYAIQQQGTSGGGNNQQQTKQWLPHAPPLLLDVIEHADWHRLRATRDYRWYMGSMAQFAVQYSYSGTELHESKLWGLSKELLQAKLGKELFEERWNDVMAPIETKELGEEG